VTSGPPPTPPASGRGDEGATLAPLPRAGGAGGGRETDTGSGRFQPRNTDRARELRNHATPAERLMWTALSNRKVAGYKFSRQMPVGPYFADFLCREMKLVLELDGFSHDMGQDHDRRRDQYMIDNGYTVIRFTNEEVLGNVDGVVQAIALALAEIGPPPTPPASGRGAKTAKSPSRLRDGLGVGASETDTRKPLGISLEGGVG
jgi:very-short-patch-repair endonuclease